MADEDPYMDTPTSAVAAETMDTSVPPPAVPAPVGLIEGSKPQLTAETDSLLRQRLRAASLMLFSGYLVFFIRNLFILDRFETNFDQMILVDHGIMTVVTGLIGYRLCTDCPILLKHLRIAEVVVFFGSAAFFLLLGYSMLTFAARQGYLQSITPAWLILVFTYALFVPNSRRRAAVVIGLLAIAPVLLTIGVYFANSNVAELIRNNLAFRGTITETALTMALAAASAIWGASRMGTLRREAFEAKQLGHYLLGEQIGAGGMGEVFLAEHLLLKRPCAIKLIRADKAGDARVLARFEREVQATAKLTHLNTIEVYDYGRAEDGTFYYVMEFLTGLSLSDLLRAHGALPPARVIHLLSQTCDALREAHEHDLVHRDIKPANIFAAHRGGVFDVAKLLDFGLVRPLTDIDDSNLTVEGGITGSPIYIAPEQVTGDSPVDARSDIYSLGAVAYHLLTGSPPFARDKVMQVLMAHVRDEPPPMTQDGALVPADLEHVVMRCLEKDPDDRFQNARDLRDAFLDCDAARDWSSEMAADWWHNHGCPKKKAMEEAVAAGA